MPAFAGMTTGRLARRACLPGVPALATIVIGERPLSIAPPRGTRAMKERFVDVATPDGPMDTFAVHPEAGGPFPCVVVFMDIWGLREELFDIARRVATVGYCRHYRT